MSGGRCGRGLSPIQERPLYRVGAADSLGISRIATPLLGSLIGSVLAPPRSFPRRADVTSDYERREADGTEVRPLTRSGTSGGGARASSAGCCCGSAGVVPDPRPSARP